MCQLISIMAPLNVRCERGRERENEIGRIPFRRAMNECRQMRDVNAMKLLEAFFLVLSMYGRDHARP